MFKSRNKAKCHRDKSCHRVVLKLKKLFLLILKVVLSTRYNTWTWLTERPQSKALEMVGLTTKQPLMDELLLLMPASLAQHYTSTATGRGRNNDQPLLRGLCLLLAVASKLVFRNWSETANAYIAPRSRYDLPVWLGQSQYEPIWVKQCLDV